MKNLVLLAVVLLLAGCASGIDGQFANIGGGSYQYKHTQKDGSTCEVSVVSGRDIRGGTLKIDNNCAVTSGVDSTNGAEAALKTIDDGINGMREAVKKIP